MSGSRKNVSAPVSHVQKLSTSIKKLHRKKTALYRLQSAGLSLETSKTKKGSVLEAHKACDKVMEAALELQEKVEKLEEYTKDLNTALRELKRLHTIVKQYQELPKIKFYGKTDAVTFWGSHRKSR